METHIRLRGEIRVIGLRGLKAEHDFLFIGVGRAHRRMPGGAGLDGVAGFENIKAVIGVVIEQRFQRLDDVLLRPGLMLPAHKGSTPAAA